MSDEYEPEYYPDEPRYDKEWTKDDKETLKCKSEIEALILKHERVFYIRELQVHFESKYFHWVSYNALKIIREENRRQIIFQEERLNGHTVIFVFNRKYRYNKREIAVKKKIIAQFSLTETTRHIGRRAEELFKLAFFENDFRFHGSNVKNFRGKTWTRTGHNLDFIVERDDRVYGCEVKNTLDYIEKEEMEIKIEMCKQLEIVPLFIMRYSPKSYNYQIIQASGRVIIFESQIYPVELSELKNKVNQHFMFKADNPGKLPEGIIKRFLGRHQKDIGN